ncbi:MAG: hypothetical protein Q8O31_07685 [Rhodocyclaceae bacterium]|nr:hypothetical protein [Rhodocyclaceae bacterium]
MNPINELRFAVSDRTSDVEIEPTQVQVSVEEGSPTSEAHQPSYDEDEFKLMVERGTQAWADVADSAAWVETLRGGKG